MLLASQRAPLVIGCLQTLFEHSQNGIAVDDAQRAPVDMLTLHVHDSDPTVAIGRLTDVPAACKGCTRE
jgi:hypothetical protein